jgi:transcriptional regulator with XRE-family HTH domain
MPNMTEEMKKALNDFIEKSGCSQEDVAHQIGVTMASLNSWLRGRQVKMNPSTFKLVQNFLGEIKTNKP